MNVRHAEQVEEMIGKKVRIYISGKKIERVLRSDSQGLYIRFEKERVSVRPDESTLNVLSFLALSPKNAAAIERTREARNMKTEQKQDEPTKEDSVKVVDQAEQSEKRVDSNVVSFCLYQLRKA
ncbi:hypothetical protein P4U44_18755, partial [Alkalihalobacillus alcalophilus]|uniref:hypothetical protein n=3 Tax=Alkalihalobacillus alcalophilus TaxID=1445 RepID=UPI002E1A08BB|nr:hypothetical protein [Alkalihalobacillus alcalophilus]